MMEMREVVTWNRVLRERPYFALFRGRGWLGI